MKNQRLVKAKVYEVIGNAREMFSDVKIPVPEITFSNRMTKCAGTYTFNPRYNMPTHTLTFSIPIIENNDVNAFCEDTVIHEVAHLIEKVAFGSTGHTSRFYNIMRKLGHKNPTRSHRFKVVDTRKKFPYQCESCGAIVELGSVRHKTVQNKKRSYHHTKCGVAGHLKFIG